jgi:hypothetical protein
MLPTVIVFVLGAGTSGSADSGGWAPVVTFLPDGPASADVDIAIRLEGGRPLVVRVRAMTGTVSVVREGQP